MGKLKFAFGKSENRECKITPEECYLPFYGVGGSIREISKKEDGNYSVTRYGNAGEEVRCWDVSLRILKNLLIYNFYPNLEEYLKCNQEKYQRKLQDIRLSKNKGIKDINKLVKVNNISKWMSMVSAALFVTSLSLPVVLVWTYISMILLALSITCFCATNDEIKDCRSLAFVNNYQYCEQRLMEYRNIYGEKRNRLAPTRFSGLVTDAKNKDDENKIVGDRHVRVKKKEEEN